MAIGMSISKTNKAIVPKVDFVLSERAKRLLTKR